MKHKALKIVISNYDSLYNPYYGGGGAMAIQEVAARLARHHNVTVLTAAYPTPAHKLPETINKVKYAYVNTNYLGPKLGQLFFSFSLPFSIQHMHFDVWIESFTPPFSTGFLPLFTNKPVIGLTHFLGADEKSEEYCLPFYFLETLGLRHYRYFISLNPAITQKIRTRNHKAHIATIPNGINPPNFSNSRKKELLRDYLLYLGRIDFAQKGLDLLLEATTKLPRISTTKLLIAGPSSPSVLAKLNQTITALRPKIPISYVGEVKGNLKWKYLLASIAVIIPSRFEIHSLVSLEALIAGKPIICFDIPGFSWLSNKFALKTKPFDTASLAQQIYKLISQPNLTRKLQQNIKHNFSPPTWDQVANQYEQFILRVHSQ